MLSPSSELSDTLFMRALQEASVVMINDLCKRDWQGRAVRKGQRNIAKTSGKLQQCVIVSVMNKMVLTY